MWIVLGTIAGIFIAAYFFEMYRQAARSRAIPSMRGKQSASSIVNIPQPAKTDFDDAMGIANSTADMLHASNLQGSGTSSEQSTSSTTCPAEEDSFLRIFDEL